MIGRLRGVIATIAEDHIIIDVQGVGYVVYCSANTLRSLNGEGETASLFIETHVREDHIHLYGFASAQEQSAFRTLTTVKGVGTRMGLTILSGLTPEQLGTALLAQDKTAFTQISGVGPKLADRLLTELKDKHFSSSLEIPSKGKTSVTSSAAQPSNAALQEAVSALTNLGYGRSDAYTVVNALLTENPSASLEELIRNGLRELSTVSA